MTITRTFLQIFSVIPENPKKILPTRLADLTTFSMSAFRNLPVFLEIVLMLCRPAGWITDDRVKPIWLGTELGKSPNRLLLYMINANKIRNFLVKN